MGGVTFGMGECSKRNSRVHRKVLHLKTLVGGKKRPHTRRSAISWTISCSTARITENRENVLAVLAAAVEHGAITGSRYLIIP